MFKKMPMSGMVTIIGIFTIATYITCASQTKLVSFSFDRKRMLVADSLFHKGDYFGAQKELNEILDNTLNREIKAQIYYKLAMLELYPKFKNKDPNLYTAREYLEKFKTEFPDNESIREVITWINILTILADHEKKYNEIQSRNVQVQSKQKEQSTSLITIQESYQRCEMMKDSLIKRIQILDNTLKRLNDVQE